MSALPDGPQLPPALQTLRWVMRPIAFLEDARRRYGDAFTIRLSGFERPQVLVSDPEAIRAIYSERANGLPAGRSAALLPVVGADSILLIEGERHLERRRLMLPPFHGERMREYTDTVREATERRIATWPTAETFALHPQMQAITLDVILDAVFGVTDPQRRAKLRERLPMLVGGATSPLLQLRVMASRAINRGDPLADVRRLLANVDELLFEEIADHHASEADGERTDVLSMLVAARFEDGKAISDRELRDQLVTLLLAGHETTATALAWAFDLLLHTPAALERLTDEVASGDDDRYLRAVVTESLRLRPVVPLAGRRLAADLELDGLSLPAGADVSPAIWLTHTRADLYPEPYAFRPERFLDDNPATYGWIPFGGGVRRCLGAAFAEMEMRVVLREVLRSGVLTAGLPGAQHAMRRNVTLSPRHGTPARWTPRVRAPLAAAA